MYTTYIIVVQIVYYFRIFFDRMNNNNNLLSEGLLQNHNDENNEEQWIDIDDDDDENEDVRNWGNTPHNNAEEDDEDDDYNRSTSSEDDDDDDDSEYEETVSVLDMLTNNNNVEDDDENTNNIIQNNNIPCTFSLPGENWKFLRTLIVLTLPVCLISMFVLLYVYDAAHIFHIDAYWVWFPMLIFALGTCAFATCKSCQLVVRREGDDEETTSDRRDRASFFCTFSLCHIMPLFFTIQVGMHVTDATPLMYFVPLMIFPSLVLLVTTLLLCCSDIDATDRCYTALFWIVITCWFSLFVGLPLKMQGVIPYSWFVTLIPSYLLDLVLLLFFYVNFKSGIKRSNGSYVAKTLVASSLYLTLTMAKFIGAFLAEKEVPYKLLYVYAPVYACAPLLLISVPIIWLCQVCSKMIYDREARYKVENRVNWEDSKRAIDDAMRKVKFEDDHHHHQPGNGSGGMYNRLPDGEDIGKVRKNSRIEMEMGGQNESSKSKSNNTGFFPSSNIRPTSSISGNNNNNNHAINTVVKKNYGSTGNSKDGIDRINKAEIIDDFEHGKMLFEEAQTEEEIINSIKHLKKLCEQHSLLRTRLYKQQLILVGQLKRSQEKFWSKDIALHFGSLLKVWSGQFNVKRSNSVDVEHPKPSIRVADSSHNNMLTGGISGARKSDEDNMSRNEHQSPPKRSSDRLKSKALNVLKGFTM